MNIIMKIICCIRDIIMGESTDGLMAELSLYEGYMKGR